MICAHSADSNGQSSSIVSTLVYTESPRVPLSLLSPPVFLSLLCCSSSSAASFYHPALQSRDHARGQCEYYLRSSGLSHALREVDAEL